MDELNSIVSSLAAASGAGETLARHVSFYKYKLFTQYPSGTLKSTNGSFLDPECDIAPQVRVPLQGSTVELDVSVQVLSDQSVLNSLRENDRGQVEGLRRLGERMPANLLLCWRASAQLPPLMITQTDISRLSKLAGAVDTKDHAKRRHDQHKLDENSIGESTIDQNYRAFMAEANRLADEYGACVVAYARGKRIALAESLSELVVNISDKYDKDDILIERVPNRTLLVRAPIRVAR